MKVYARDQRSGDRARSSVSLSVVSRALTMVPLLGLVIVLLATPLLAQEEQQLEQRSLCVPPASAPPKLEAIIEQCQDEIKQAVLEEALQALGDAGRGLEVASHNRSKRDTFTGEERRIAGCLLQCVYRKVKAVDENGLPTASGLVRLYTEGVSDRNYFLATVQAVHQCLTLAGNRRSYNPQALQEGGYTCDLAYDMFNCVSDRIESICGRTP